MWRLFQHMPRVAARQWNNSVASTAPQTACRENGAAPCGSSQRGIHITAALPITWENDRNNRDWQKYRYNSAGGKKKSKKTTDCDWDEWFRSFSCSWWHAAGHPQLLEAFGCSTALLLGLHLSQYYKLWNCQHRRKCTEGDGGGCVGHHLHQLAITLPVLRRGSCPVNQVLPPPSSTTPLKPAASIKDEDTIPRLTTFTHRQDFVGDIHELQHSGSWLTNIPDDNQVQSNVEKAKKIPDCTPDVLSDSRSDWSELDKLYVTFGRNLAAHSHALQGDMMDAINLWEDTCQLASSCYNLGVCHELGFGVQKDVKAAATYYERAVKQGHLKSSYNLARLYLHGIGVCRDTDKAKDLLHQAADNGLSKAQSDLAVIYATQEQSMQLAVSLFEKAAEEKDVSGQYNLGLCYQYGWGVDRNLCKAADLYSWAAHQGHKQAQCKLAHFFQQGLGGLPVDNDCATKWTEAANTCNQPCGMLDSLVGVDYDPSPSYAVKDEDHKVDPRDGTAIDDHVMCQAILSDLDRDHVESRLSKHLFYIPDSESECSESGSDTSCDSDQFTVEKGHFGEILPKITQRGSFNKISSDKRLSAECSIYTKEDRDGSISLRANEQNSKPYEFLIEEGNFGDLLPKVPLLGSFGDIQLGKSEDKSKWRRQAHSVADFRLFSSALPDMAGDNFTSHEDLVCSMDSLHGVMKQNTSCSLQGLESVAEVNHVHLPIQYM